MATKEIEWNRPIAVHKHCELY